MKNSHLIISLFVVLLSLASCGNQKLLLSETEGDLQDLLALDSTFQHNIRPDDKLSLSIWNHNDLSMGSVFSVYNSNESFGKWVLVDQNGFTQLPKVGKVKLDGLNCNQAADTLIKLYEEDIKDPIIVVKILNRKVTVLGEVRTPGAYIIEEEQVNLMEIIGKAQGFTNYANTKELKLIRNDRSYSLNLEHMNEYMLHRILLQSDDLVIITSKRGKALDQKAPVLIPFASVLTAVALVTSVIIAK